MQNDEWDDPPSPGEPYYSHTDPDTRRYGSSEEGDDDDDEPILTPVSLSKFVDVCGGGVDTGCWYQC